MTEEPNPYAPSQVSGQAPLPRLDSDPIAFGRSLKLARLRKGLLFLAGIYALSGILQAAIVEGPAWLPAAIGGALWVVIHLGLWALAPRAPLVASSLAAALFVIPHLLSFIAEPTTLFMGLPVKILSIAILFANLRIALELRSPPA